MNKELAYKVIEALNKNGIERKPDSEELRPIAKQLGAKLRSGCTRWAFVFEKHRTVVKLPKYDETDKDYCAKELENYTMAKEYRVERCLLPIEYMGETDGGIPVYVQPMYTTSHCDLDRTLHIRWTEQVKKVHQAKIADVVRCGCLYSPPRLWVERAIQIYGKAFMHSFEHWTHECKVNDLHDSNVGWLGKQPVIIDYAGYYG